jgi:DNA-binding NarL/FixJ family response regulator
VQPEVRILVMSMHEERQYALPALRAGAHGYMSKRADPESFLEALRFIAEGQVYVSDSFRSQLIYRVLSATFPGENPLQILTERELQVLTLVGEGLLYRTPRGVAGIERQNRRKPSLALQGKAGAAKCG